MKVKDLIEKLQKCNPDLPVVIHSKEDHLQLEWAINVEEVHVATWDTEVFFPAEIKNAKPAVLIE